MKSILKKKTFNKNKPWWCDISKCILIIGDFKRKYSGPFNFWIRVVIWHKSLIMVTSFFSPSLLLCVLAAEHPMSLLGKLHRQQGAAGGGATLNKEAGLRLVGEGGQRMKRAGGEGQRGPSGGKDMIEWDSSRWTGAQPATHFTKDCTHDGMCVTGWQRVRVFGCKWVSVLWSRLQWRVIFLRGEKKGNRLYALLLQLLSHSRCSAERL